MTVAARKKKLIEVALPLDEINAACKADKDRKTGTLRNIHKWFAPMPLPAWRALLFAALVDDPEDEIQRVQLLDLIKRLVANGADLPDAKDLSEAQTVLRRQYPKVLPTVFDPFCGGGSTLVEALRLGLPAYGSDLNPVPALISRTLAGVLPPVIDGQPVSKRRSSRETLLDIDRAYSGLDGFAVDVIRYAEELKEELLAALSDWYPPEPDGHPVAWLWVRTAKCQNPVCGIDTPLATSWWLSKKAGEYAWLDPQVIDRLVRFEVVSRQRAGSPLPPPKLGRANFRCLCCGGTVTSEHLKTQAAHGGLGLRMTAVVVSRADGSRAYRAATEKDELAGLRAIADSAAVGLNVPLTNDPRSIWCVPYGVTTQADMYGPRQLAVLTTLADLVASVPERVERDGGDDDWARAVTTFLGLAVGQMALTGSTQTRWRLRATAHAKAEGAFARNDIPMMWDYAETYPASGSVGDWIGTVTSMTRGLPYIRSGVGQVVRADARTTASPSKALVATDPPYFDAISYADLSDFFYVWHRRALRNVHPDLYGTLAAPKANELTAVPVHHDGSKEKARNYFIQGFTDTFGNLQRSMHSALPMLVVYASKEQRGGQDEQTRWSSILTAMVNAELEITGTWPIHGTGSTRMVGIGTNAVASYIVMVCRPRPVTATTCSVSDFNRALRRELGPAVRDLQAASILPVDLAQAAMGPGMQIFTRYRAVLDQTGKSIAVDQALRFINIALAEVRNEQEGELDLESQFGVRWWETYGWGPAEFGEADKAVRPLGISVDHVKRAQVATSVGNKVRLLGNGDLDRTWMPSTDLRPTAWEAVHHLADRLVDGGGELEAAHLMANLGTLKDSAMALVYRLHDIAARKGRTGDQERYNALISSWTELVRLSGDSQVTAEALF